MAKRKGPRPESPSTAAPAGVSGFKKNAEAPGFVPERPLKKAKLMLDDDESDEDSDDSDYTGGVKLPEPISDAPEAGFKINEEYARRFDHNKKREELHRLEEKYGKASSAPRTGAAGRSRHDAVDDEGDDDDDDDDVSSSDLGDEDDDAALATEALDAEISATLQAIKSKDPRVYDDKATFYTSIANDEGDQPADTKQAKPMFLRDYHRKNLLEGHVGDTEDEPAVQTYAQEQDDLQRAVVREMHAAAEGAGAAYGNGDGDSDDDDDGGFIVPKAEAHENGANETRAARPKQPVEAAVAMADKDPESFLSNFMASRAWVPTPASRFQPFDSDDDDDEARADAFEEAYNLRFEDPEGANEKLRSHARDATAKHSVRRDEASGRKRVREVQRQKRESAAEQRFQEKARLRRLKLDEAEERVARIKEAAGLRGQAIKVDEWADFLNAGWDDDRWEAEMKKRFGEDYYAEADEGADDAGEGPGGAARRKTKKPRWDDDIDIKDLVPDFDDEAHEGEAGLALSSADDDAGVEGAPVRRKPKKRDHVQERKELKRAARQERRALEELVDERLGLDALPPTASRASGFRYRETSPVTYGLTARDILLASDSQLNQFAGLKKLAAFRDAEKKRRDRKRLGKKARLRQWRKETFGDERGVVEGIGGEAVAGVNGEASGAGGKRRKRSGKGKGKAAAA